MSLTEPESPKGTPLPIPQFPVVGVLAVSLAFFLAALGEELGWSGYIIDPMEDRWGAPPAAILLGTVWAIWPKCPTDGYSDVTGYGATAVARQPNGYGSIICASLGKRSATEADTMTIKHCLQAGGKNPRVRSGFRG